jgi:exopolysaccharide biosynthesis polyprenyl glycosylphosphotransferase
VSQDRPERAETAIREPQELRGAGDGLSAASRPSGLHTRGLVDGNVRSRRMLVLSDLTALLFALLAGLYVAGSLPSQGDGKGLVAVAVVILPLWVLSAYAANLYHDFEQRIDRNFVDESGRLILILMAWSWLAVMFLTVWTSSVDVIATSLFTFVFAVPLLVAGRAVVRLYVSRQPWNLQPVALIGDETGLISLRNRIERHPEWRLDVRLEFLASRPAGGSGDAAGDASIPVLVEAGDPDGKALDAANLLGQVCEAGVVRTMLVGGVDVFGDFASKTELIQELHDAGVGVDVVSGGPENLYSAALQQDIEGLPLVSLRPPGQRPFSLQMKRAFDLVVSIASLIVVSPLLLWCAVRIRMDSPGPVIFRQTRIGLEGQPFEIYKFRTMVDGAHEQRPELRVATRDAGNDDVLFKIPDDPRVTPVGRTLRRWSLDELPQLANVVKGQMSMVGPRPLVPEEAAQVGPLFEARASVKPGIAGPWQALGRSSIPFSDMVKLDYAYAMGRSLTTDVYLLIRTLVAVLRRQGAH